MSSATNPAALARWPNVPACYGWLALDRRGNWRLQDETVTHGGLIAYLNTNYARDDDGNWLVWNGPQRVYVALDYLPLVVRIDGDGKLHTHTGAPCEPGAQAFIDDEGNALLCTSAGPALVDDRDLAIFLAEVRDAGGSAADEAALAAKMEGAAEPALFWRGLPLRPIMRAQAAQHFGFKPAPSPPAS